MLKTMYEQFLELDGTMFLTVEHIRDNLYYYRFYNINHVVFMTATLNLDKHKPTFNLSEINNLITKNLIDIDEIKFYQA